MPTGLVLVAIVVVAVLVALGALLYLHDRLAYRAGLRKLEKRAPTRVADAKHGAPVRLVGRVRLPDRPLEAPVTLRPCAAWQVKVQQRQQNEHGAWMADPYDIGDKQKVVTFFLEDETGVARVEATDAQLLLVREPAPHEGKAEADAIRARLEAGEGQIRIRDGGGIFVFQEAVLEAGEPVTVMGLAAIEDDPTAKGEGYRGGGRRLVVRSGGGEPLLISDDPEVTGG
ncbi:MAG: hypothetical protein KC619_18505 [Myxococcales bacterium]|nr:hypothetical protein [Myxococcales bacterium]